MQNKFKPEIVVFASPNGSGKSTITGPEKIRSRYEKSLANIPEFLRVCDVCHIYDNTDIPFRICRKHKESIKLFENEYWSYEQIQDLILRKANTSPPNS